MNVDRNHINYGEDAYWIMLTL